MTESADSRLVDLLREAQQILIFTGAGISTNCGIPDYRGPKGIWKTRQPVYYQDFMASEEARVEYWDQKVSDWDAFRDATPSRVHRAVADLEAAGKIAMVVTQNIDGLHSKAGSSDGCLVEVHGTNREIECQSCYERSAPDAHHEQFRATRKAPLCHCGGFLKSATISFGQALRNEDLQRAAEAAQIADLVVALGSSLSVHPAASIPLAAAQLGTAYVIINRGQTDQDDLPLVTLRLDGDVDELFAPAVEQALNQRARLPIC